MEALLMFFVLFCLEKKVIYCNIPRCEKERKLVLPRKLGIVSNLVRELRHAYDCSWGLSKTVADTAENLTLNTACISHAKLVGNTK